MCVIHIRQQNLDITYCGRDYYAKYTRDEYYLNKIPEKERPFICKTCKNALKKEWNEENARQFIREKGI